MVFGIYFDIGLLIFDNIILWDVIVLVWLI